VVFDLGKPLYLSAKGPNSRLTFPSFLSYLGSDVIERGRADDGEADEEDVALRVRERSKAVIIFLSSSIPKTQTHGFAINLNICGVVIEAVFCIRHRSPGGKLWSPHTVGIYSPGKALVV